MMTHGPDVPGPGSDMSSSALDVSTSTPDVPISAPDVSISAPDVSISAPDLSISAPLVSTSAPDVTPVALFSSQEKIHQLYQELSISDTDPQIRVQVENVLSSLLGEVRQLQDENKHMEKLYIR